MKYIDADLLRKEIESRMGDCDANSKNPNQLLWAELAALIPFIDSLQQEQDLIVINKKTWEAQEQFRKNKDFGKPLQQEQPTNRSVTTKELIRQEIERRKELLTPHKGQGVILCREIIKQFNSLLSFIDTIPQPIVKDDIIDEIRTEIERRFLEYNHDSSHHIQAAECASILDFLDTLNPIQQEQSCDTCTNDKGCVTCKDGELWEGKEQPFEDLEAEMKKYFDGWIDDPEYGQAVIRYTSQCVGVSDCEDIARHFYELGKNSK